MTIAQVHPSHEEHNYARRWIGGSFDATACDINEI
jgi:hypothetical protein